MSVISNVHSFVTYDPKANQKPYDGQRLAKIKFRFTQAQKDRGETEKQAMAVSVPLVSFSDLESNFDLLKAMLLDTVIDTQDLLLRSLLEDGKTSVSDDQISISSIVAFYNSTGGTSGRLNGDQIKEWFTDTLKDKLMLAFADKLGVPDSPSEEDNKKIEIACNVYRDKIAMFASPKTKFDLETVGKLEKALALIPDDALAVKFTARLEQMKTQQSVDLLAL
jgi:hypothetical protein